MTETVTTAASEKTSSASPLTAAQRRAALIAIALTNFLLSFGFQLWRSLFNNFAVGELGVDADQIGLIQSIREVPGLLGFTVGLLAMALPEMRIVGLSVALTGVGIAMTGGAAGLPTLLVSTLVMSVGFHYYMPSNSSAVLQMVGEDEAPHTLGRLTSLNALAAVAGAGFVFLALEPLGFRTLFYVTGGLLTVGGLVALAWTFGKSFVESRRAQEQALEAVHPVQKTPLRRRYWLFYALQFLMGSRRHIITTFAVFLLVQEHDVNAKTITLLYVVNNLIGTFFYQQIGKLIVRFGERLTLSVNFLLLIFVFLGYAYVPSLPILFALFIADQMLFGFRIALHSYFQKIAVCPEEITPNLSLGQTINHIAAVIIPLVGGVVWAAVGSRYTFLVGVGIVTVALIVTQWMDVEPGAAPAPVTEV